MSNARHPEDVWERKEEKKHVELPSNPAHQKSSLPNGPNLVETELRFMGSNIFQRGTLPTLFSLSTGPHLSSPGGIKSVQTH